MELIGTAPSVSSEPGGAVRQRRPEAGRAAAVAVHQVCIDNAHRYESLKETAYLLRNPENARRLLASIDRLENSGGIQRDLAE